MKKKLLSLVLAGAMVASTSVSAFAADTGKEYNILNKEEVETPITITGNIQDSTGAVLPSTINVTVPTAAAFTVTSEGNFTSAPIEISSKSDEKVQVTAYSFTDSSEDANITIVGEDELSNKTNEANNKFMSLKLIGTDGTVYFKSTKTKSGVYKKDGSEYKLTDNPILGTVTQNTPLTLNLKGDIKKDDPYSAPSTAISDQFNLVLKIRRVR